MKLAPYPQYKDSASPAVPEIPDRWTTNRCRYLFREVDDRSEDGQETHLSMSQEHGLIDSSKIDRWRLQSESYAGGKLCVSGDLVLNRLKAHLGVFAHAKQSGVVSPDYTVLRPLTDDSPRFFEFLFKSPPFVSEFTRSTKGIVKGFWRLYTDDFYSIRAIVPPSEEQKQILRFIDSLTARANKFIRNKRRLIELLNEQKQNIINQAVTRGLDPNVRLKPSGVEWIGDIPEHWEVRKLKFASKLIVGGATPASGQSEFWDGDVVWVTPQDVSKNERLVSSARKLSLAGYTSCSSVIVPPGSVVVTSRAPVGNVSIAEVELCTNQGCKSVVPDGRHVLNEYCFVLLKAMQSVFQMASNGTTFFEISTWTFENVKVPLPPTSEQEKILGHLKGATSTIDEAISRAQREIELMREYRIRLISDVVTGQVDVRGIKVPEVAEDELLALEDDAAESDEVVDDEGEMDESD